MGELSINFRERAPELDGQPTLDKFLISEAHRGSIGQDNANRLLAFGAGELVTSQTVRLLQEIADGDGIAQHQKFIWPLLRTAEDFTIDDLVYYQPPGGGWDFDLVWAIVPSTTPEDVDEEELNDGIQVSQSGITNGPRGAIILRRSSRFVHLIAPNWPGLVDSEFYRSVINRKTYPLSSEERRRLIAIGSGLINASFFDPDIDMSKEVSNNPILDAVYHSLRHFALKLPKRIN